MAQGVSWSAPTRPPRTPNRHLGVLLDQRREPETAEYERLKEGAWSEYRLRVDGLVETPLALSYDELRAMPKQEQITQHFCIQGWSGIAKWGGVSMRAICEAAGPTAEAKWVVFYSFADGPVGGRYYDCHPIANMYHDQTILAYEMNGQPSTSPTVRHCDCATRSNSASNRSSGSRPSSSSNRSTTSVRARAATTRTRSSTATACRSESRSRRSLEAAGEPAQRDIGTGQQAGRRRDHGFDGVECGQTGDRHADRGERLRLDRSTPGREDHVLVVDIRVTGDLVM